MSGHTPRYCLRCRYDLSHTPSGACPECGNSFDPADARSYSHTASRLSRRCLGWGVVFSAYPLGFVLWVHVKFIVRWVYTGTRPTYGSGRTMPEWWNSIGDTIETIYPLKVFISESDDTGRELVSEEQFYLVLRKILQDPKSISVVRSLIAQSE